MDDKKESEQENILAEAIIESNKEQLDEKDYEEDFKAMLRKTSYGTELREALEKISEANAGALIVLATLEKIKDISLGGFKVNCDFTPERLFELSKMDGAIIVDPHLKKIHYANLLLIPDTGIASRETGTRHQAAERTAKQTENLVIAVSQRTGNITLYTKYFRYKLRSLATLITRLQSVLDSLDGQKKIFSSLINYLNILEFTNLVTAIHVIALLQKAELLMRGNKIARRYLTELGSESQLLELRLKEIMKDVEDDYFNVLRDYGKNPSQIRQELSKLSYDDLLEFDSILKILGFNSIEQSLEAKGYRIVDKIPDIEPEQTKIIVKHFDNLKKILDASIDELKNSREIKNPEMIKDELEKLKNSAMLSQGI